MIRSIVEMYVMTVLVVFMCAQQERVRLYRQIDRRLGFKSTVITVWHSNKSDARRDRDREIAYIDIPAILLFECIPTGTDSKYGRYFMLKGRARRFAQRSWKVMTFPAKEAV